MDKRLQEIERLKQDMQKKLKGKPFKNLSTPDKDYLLEGIAIILGILEDSKRK